MKCNFKITYFILVTSALLCSCEVYHFARPLPIDSKNVYKTPKKFRGLETDPASDGLKFEKNYVALTEDKPIKIINGIWVNPRDTSSIQRSDTVAWRKLQDMKFYKSRYTILFDSLKVPTDTVDNYVIKGDMIYTIGESQISPGFPYVIRGDTIYVTISQFRFMEFGPSAFFRKVTADYYILNMRNSE